MVNRTRRRGIGPAGWLERRRKPVELKVAMRRWICRPSFRMKILPVILWFFLILPEAVGQTQLRFVTWRPEAAAVWQELITGFEARHPGVKVVREVGPHSSTEFHDLVTQKLRNRDPEMDVFFMDVIWPGEFAAAGWALPLDGFFSAAQQKEFLTAPIAANRYQGRIYGVPHVR